MPRPDQQVIDDFHKGWHQSVDGTWHKCYWRGYKLLKCPMDLWIYQELIMSLKPSLIIETGTCFGGSALFLADMLELAGRGRVVTVDIKVPKNPPRHKRLSYVTGSSVDAATVEAVKKFHPKAGHIMVILDSNHKQAHVEKELEIYAPLVTKGSYVIVEDTSINRLVRHDHGPGPGEAVDTFMAGNENFVVDAGCEKFYMTFNPGGYLKRVR
jgi:cephalosporin hydroxylase